MSLAEALAEALPSLPPRSSRSDVPRLNPDIVYRENIEDGEPVVVVIIRGDSKIFRFSTTQWNLIELFDGLRSWQAISDLYAERYGLLYEVADLREFASAIDRIGLWYRPLLDRHQHIPQKSRWSDVAHIVFSAWDPDEYLNRIHTYLKWIYTPWFTAITVVLFAYLACFFVANGAQIGRDTLTYFNLTAKTSADLAEFYLLFFVIGFIHESAHGLTCKHFGGGVHSMGFHLIFMTPAFFVDVSEGWVYASRWQRLAIIVAGVWLELIVCGLMSLVWWGTPQGSDLHDIAYKIVLLTGLSSVLLNMNPLIKLDGYYALSEIIGFSDIKEKSTAYFSGLLRRHLFRMPVQLEFVPRRRRVPFVLYAMLSGAYSYMLLFLFIRFVHNLLLRWMFVWAFVPTIIVGVMLYGSRLRTLHRFLQSLYLDKVDRMRTFRRSAPFLLGAFLLFLLLVAPLWRETVTARFVLEPIRREVVRTLVPGQVSKVLVAEGQQVRAGEPLVRLQNLQLASQQADAAQRLRAAGFAQTRTQLAHETLGAVRQQYLQARGEESLASEQTDQLVARASMDGTITTPRMQDLNGSFLDAGSLIAQVADTREMRARLYIPEYQIDHVSAGAPVHLLTDGSVMGLSTRVDRVEPGARTLPSAVESVSQVGGGSTLQFYVADAVVTNDGVLKDGMTGTAKVLLQRRSLLYFAWQQVREFAKRKLW